MVFGMRLCDLLGVVLSLTLRCLLTPQGHSGQANPPMFGDYEAQRHWQEITNNLPISEWYHNTTDNDLQYWGLDYPPLTAYHSYLLAKVAHKIDPDFVALNKSRGIEHSSHKAFMRNSVLLSDVLVFIPSVYLLSKILFSGDGYKSSTTACILLLYPGLMLIDNGHFQYNNMSLGLFIFAVSFILTRRTLIGSSLFVLALNYKQMELYHAFPFFFYLLGECFWMEKTYSASIWKLICIGTTVIVTFVAVWAPFLTDLESTTQVVSRIFPVGRGIFEDKVANFWCSLNLVYKLKTALSNTTLMYLCIGSTLSLSLPSNLHLFFQPRFENFLLSLVNTSFIFFLFSYQVHEKSILLVAIPVGLYAMFSRSSLKMNDSGFCKYTSAISVWFLTVSTFSMFPLFLKDGLAIPSIVLTALYVTIAVYFDFCKPDSGPRNAISPRSRRVQPVDAPSKWDGVLNVLMNLSLSGCLALCLANMILAPPTRLPDLWNVLISFYASAHFMVFAAYFHYVQFFGCRSEKKKLH